MIALYNYLRTDHHYLSDRFEQVNPIRLTLERLGILPPPPASPNRRQVNGAWVHLKSFLFFFFSCTLQSFFRGWKTRRELTRLKSAVLIQSNIRGWMERRRYHHTRQLVIGLQAATRAWLCQKNYRQLKDATVLLQRRVRGNNAATKAREEYLATKRAAVALQSFYRGRQVRRYVVKLKAVILVQCWFRATAAARKAREEYKALKEASLVLQAAYRGYCGRMFTRQLRAARTIQAVVRGFLIRRRIKVRIKSA